MRNDSGSARLWSAIEVAEYCGVPVSTVYAWRRRGVGPPAMSVGKYLRFNPDDLRVWLDGKRRA
jgi:excisionase family DNA binding protein